MPHEQNKKSKQKHSYPGELALQKKILSGRRFVWFPVAKSKIIEKIEFYTSREYHCLRLDFRDRTFLALQITPRFTINADYQQRAKDEPIPLAEWPAIHSQT